MLLGFLLSSCEIHKIIFGETEMVDAGLGHINGVQGFAGVSVGAQGEMAAALLADAEHTQSLGGA